MNGNYRNFDNTLSLGESLGISMFKGESEPEFRLRLAQVMLEINSEALKVTDVLTGIKGFNLSDLEKSVSDILNRYHTELESRKADFEGDTFYKMPWSEFTEIIENNGFEKVFSQDFIDPKFNNTNEYSIWANSKYGMLLEANSDSGRRLSKGNVYAEIKWINDNDTKNAEYGLRNQGLSDMTERYLHTQNPLFNENLQSMVIALKKSLLAGGLFQYIDDLEKYGVEFNNPWRNFKNHSLNLVDPSEYDQNKIPQKGILLDILARKGEKLSAAWNDFTMKKLLSMPEDVQYMIGMPKLYTIEGK